MDNDNEEISPSFLLLPIIINLVLSRFKLSLFHVTNEKPLRDRHLAYLQVQDRVICVQCYFGAYDDIRQVIYINKEKQRSQEASLWHA